MRWNQQCRRSLRECRGRVTEGKEGRADFRKKLLRGAHWVVSRKDTSLLKEIVACRRGERRGGEGRGGEGRRDIPGTARHCGGVQVLPGPCCDW